MSVVDIDGIRQVYHSLNFMFLSFQAATILNGRYGACNREMFLSFEIQMSSKEIRTYKCRIRANAEYHKMQQGI